MPLSSRVTQLLKMLEEDKNDVFLNYALGLEYAQQSSQFEAAVAQYLKVLSIDENYIAAYYQLGQLHEQHKLESEALLYYKKGLDKAKLIGNKKSANEFEEAIFLLED